MFDVKEMGKKIRELRNKRSQDEVAQALGISRGALSFYENGERKPDADVIFRMCEYFNVTSDFLLGLSDVKSYDMELQGVCKYTGLSERAVKALRMCKENVSGYDEPNTGILGLNHFMESIYFIDFATQLRDICRLYSDKITDADIFNNLYFTNGELKSDMEVSNDVVNALELIKRAGYTTIRKSQYFDLCIQNAETDLQRAFQDWKDEFIKDVINNERWD